MKIDPEFFSKVEKETQYIIYGDTDSLYIQIPEKINNVEEAIKRANEISKQINNIIEKFMNEFYLPRSGIDKKYNYTDFKTEIVSDAIILLDIKKNYAYRILAKENVPYNPPKIKYTGIPVIRTDYSEFTKDMIKYLVGEIALADDKDKTAVVEFLKECRDKLDKCIKEGDFNYIGVPTKWGIKEYKKDTTQIVSMKLYNTLIGREYFRPAVSGKRVPIIIKDPAKVLEKLHAYKDKGKYFLSNTDISKLNFLCFPLGISSNQSLSILDENKIEVDANELWNIVFSKVCERIVEVISNQ